jgi:hypothetical protein
MITEVKKTPTTDVSSKDDSPPKSETEFQQVQTDEEKHIEQMEKEFHSSWDDKFDEEVEIDW